jgi:hypothetical protein
LIGRLIRDITNLLIYGGLFIGLCAACITALTFEVIGRASENLTYTILVGTATAALYSIHRVIGLHKTAHLKTSERFVTIREFLLWLLPGGVIAFTYVIPFLSGGRRLRDLGWGKIVMIGWSWAWLTAFIPMFYFGEASIQMAVLIALSECCLSFCLRFHLRYVIYI